MSNLNFRFLDMYYTIFAVVGNISSLIDELHEFLIKPHLQNLVFSCTVPDFILNIL